MATYEAPIRDILFVLNELAGAEELSRLPGFEEATPDMLEAILDEANKLASEVLSPLNQTGDQQGSVMVDDKIQVPEGFADAYEQFVSNGWLGLGQNTDYGGQGLPFSLHMAVSEMWNSANMSLALCPMLTAGAIEAIDTHADDELKQKYLPKLVSGEWTGTMNLTESHAGSDLAAISSKAIPEGDHYLISGQKIFITWGDHEITGNIVHLVLARLPNAPPGIKGISLFIVPKYLLNEDGSVGERNDVRPVSLEHKLGIHASPTCVMSFGENKGAVGYLIGEAHSGMACMFTMMNHARLEVGIEGVGLSQMSYQSSVEYARERVQGSNPESKERVAIIEHGDVRRMLMLMRTLTEATRAVALVSASTFDRARKSADSDQQLQLFSRLHLLTPIVKAWCTEVAQEVCSLGIQVHGGMGYIEETGVAQYLRDVRITSIYEGTNGIQANDLVGRKILKDGGISVNALFDEVDELNKQLAQSSDADLDKMGVSLAIALNDIRVSTYSILARSNDHDFSNSIAFNYLMMLGTLIGAWQMARAALISKERLNSENTDIPFYKNKILTCKFYIEQILPRYKSYFDSISTTGNLSMEMKNEDF
jgi:alkylation response protein AidB-like acyl-CoA dehydrogenase